MKNKILKICSLIAIVVLSAVVGLLAFVDIYGVKVASAETVDSKQVIEDLQRDKSFVQSDYPTAEYSVELKDSLLQVFQIGETADDELIIYVYRPCYKSVDVSAKKISLSVGYSKNGEGLSPSTYNLKLLSRYTVFDKYRVVGFELPNAGDRYYNIVEIFRDVDETIDEVNKDDFEISYKAISVGQQWYACDLNGDKHYEMNTFNTFPCQKIFDGNMLLNSGFNWGDIIVGIKSKKCAVWFYCFNSPEYVIKHIYDATMGYSIEDAHLYGPAGVGAYTYSNQRPNQDIKITDDDIMHYKGGGLFADTYEIKRILPSTEFIKQVENQGLKFGDGVREKILSSEWTFCYLDTEYTEDSFYGYKDINRQHVYDVGLLQIHFMDINHKIYDLGVVDDLSTPDMISDITNKTLGDSIKEFWDIFVKAILLILFIILLVLLLNFVPPVKRAFKFIFKGISFVIALPFKALKSIFGKK